MKKAVKRSMARRMKQMRTVTIPLMVVCRPPQKRYAWEIEMWTKLQASSISFAPMAFHIGHRLLQLQLTGRCFSFEVMAVFHE